MISVLFKLNLKVDALPVFSCKMFTSVVTKLPESQSTKSKRLHEQRLLSRNQNANFHFYFPEHAEFHVIKLNDPCWPEMELDEKLKFVDPDNFGKFPSLSKGKMLPLDILQLLEILTSL